MVKRQVRAEPEPDSPRACPHPSAVEAGGVTVCARCGAQLYLRRRARESVHPEVAPPSIGAAWGGRRFAIRPDPREPAEYEAECVDCGARNVADGDPAQHVLWLVRHTGRTGHAEFSTVEVRSLVVVPGGGA